MSDGKTGTFLPTSGATELEIFIRDVGALLVVAAVSALLSREITSWF